MFEHKLYMPNISHKLRDEVRDLIIEDVGGFTHYFATGYWDMYDGKEMVNTSEPVIVFEVITRTNEMPRGFVHAKKGLFDLGESCVLTTIKRIKAEFHYNE